jgi:acyl-CoA synthetase (AMP-forming)/AMP-acid ligase II
MALVDLIASFPDDKTALVHPDPDLRLTFGKLREQIHVLALALEDAGVSNGDRIAIAMPNSPSLVVALLAASTIGAAMPLHGDRDGGFDSSSGDTAARITADRDGFHVTRATKKGSDPVSDPLVFEDTALLIQTRGTSGRPKRVALSHGNLSMAALQTAATLQLGPDDVSLCVMPLAHVHGLVSATLATLASGGTVVIPSAFHPVTFWRVARDYGVTWYTAAPQIHQWLLARTADPGVRRPAGAARLRFIRSSGAMLPPAVRQTLESAFAVPVVEAYELTEASGQAAVTSVPRASSLRPQPGVSIGILDPTGRMLGPDTEGEVALAGPTIARGYDGDVQATCRFFVDGWFRTGDFGYLDADGCLTLAREHG